MAKHKEIKERLASGRVMKVSILNWRVQEIAKSQDVM
jgi:hypothetical protein